MINEDPTEYNELVELVENNDPGVVASVIQDTHTPNERLWALVRYMRLDASVAEEHDYSKASEVVSEWADELEEAIGSDETMKKMDVQLGGV